MVHITIISQQLCVLAHCQYLLGLYNEPCSMIVYFPFYKYNSCMLTFKQFVHDQLNYYFLHFQKKRVLLELNGDIRHEIDLSFSHLSDLYLNHLEQHPHQQPTHNNTPTSAQLLTTSQIKINDNDLLPLWQHIDSSYRLSLNLEGQDVGDETILKLSELYLSKNCAFTKIKLAGNSRISGVGIAKLGQSLQGFHDIEEISLHGLQASAGGINRIIELISTTQLTNLDLGLIGDDSLRYLSTILQNQHHIQSLSFSESLEQKWSAQGKLQFQRCVRRSQSCKQILAFNIYPDQLVLHYEMISELNIICKKNRSLRIEQRENQFKAATLNPNHPKYYEPDNHSLNAYKFSVKSYLNNVFGSLLDQALYFIEKQRRNSLREQAIFNITKQPINKIILEDICTADGSIIVLTKYLLRKIKEKEGQH